MALGAQGYILKGSAMQEIVAGVKAVAAGRPYLSSAMTLRLLQIGTSRPVQESGGMSGLTPVERQILKLVATGKSSKEIGGRFLVPLRALLWRQEVARQGSHR